MPAKSKFVTHKQQTIDSFHGFLKGNGHPRFPLEIFLEISNVCNLKCAMCSVFSELNPHRLFALKAEHRGFLDRKYIESLGPLLSHSLLVHCYGYGEPTVHPEFVELLDFILEHEVLVDFFTNGMNLSEELCAFLVDRKVFRVTVSFSGSTPEDYENMYLNGDYQRVLDGIERLHRHKLANNSPYPDIEVNSIAFRHHIDRLVEFVEIMAARGVNTISLKPLHGYSSLPMLHSHIAVMRPEVEGKILDQAKQLAMAKGVRLVDEFSNVATVETPEQQSAVRQRLIWGDQQGPEQIVPIGEFKKIAKDIQPLVPPKQAHASHTRPPSAMDQTPETIGKFLDIRVPEHPSEILCSQPFKTFYVSQQGAVRPCCFGFTGVHLGNLQTADGEAIWNGIGYRESRDAIQRGEYPMKICKACLQQKSYPKSDAFVLIGLAYASWYKKVFGEDFKSAVTYYAQMFVDTGRGFNEMESLVVGIKPSGEPQTIEFDLVAFPIIKRLRFDPINTSAAIAIYGAELIDHRDAHHMMPPGASNAQAWRDNRLIFVSEDPQIVFSELLGQTYRKAIFSLSYYSLPPEMENH